MTGDTIYKAPRTQPAPSRHLINPYSFILFVSLLFGQPLKEILCAPTMSQALS